MVRKIELRIDELLEERGMSQQLLADLAGVRQAVVSNLAGNRNERIKLAHLEKIAEVLDLDDISELMRIVRKG